MTTCMTFHYSPDLAPLEYYFFRIKKTIWGERDFIETRPVIRKNHQQTGSTLNEMYELKRTQHPRIETVHLHK